jgi:hypothetical protein
VVHLGEGTSRNDNRGPGLGNVEIFHRSESSAIIWTQGFFSSLYGHPSIPTLFNEASGIQFKELVGHQLSHFSLAEGFWRHVPYFYFYNN